MKKKCKWCNSVAYMESAPKMPLCIKHTRFFRMRAECATRNKYKPSYAELDRLLDNINKNFLCPICKVKMVWLRSENSKAVLTLQHDRSGKLRFICLSCNSKHGSLIGDSYYIIDKSKKRCSKCGIIKDLNNFYKKKYSDTSSGYTSKCKLCILEYNKLYTINNRQYINRRCRLYYAEKISGKSTSRSFMRSYPVGEFCNFSKLKKTTVIKIKKELLAKTNTIQQIAKKFGVGVNCIKRISCGKTWKHIS